MINYTATAKEMLNIRESMEHIFDEVNDDVLMNQLFPHYEKLMLEIGKVVTTCILTQKV